MLRWLNRGVLLVCLLGSSGVAVAQSNLDQEAKALNQQVDKLYQKGRYHEAIPLAQKVLVLWEKALRPDHPGTAAALNNLAALYRATGAYAKAEPLYQRALAIYEKALGADHPNTAMVLNNLAELYRATGAYAKAEPLYQRALAITEKVPGPEHPGTATALNNLAALYQGMGAYSKAEPLHQRVLAITEKVLESEHPGTATALNNLAELYRVTGAYAKAEPLYQRALAIYEKGLGPDHPNTAMVLSNLAELYRTTGASGKAEPLYQRALAIMEKVLGPEHPGTATALNNLAVLYRATGAYAKAEPLYQQALAIREKVLGPNHPDTATAHNNLAELYQATGAYAEAEPLYQRALAIMEKELAAEHPTTAIALNNLAELYRVTGAYAKAEPLYQRALAIYEKALGPDHPDTATVLNNQALLYWARGDLERAEVLSTQVQAIREKNLTIFLLAGSESRKHAYLAKVRGETSAAVSFSLVMADRQAAFGFQSVLMVKGRVLDAMSDSVGQLRRSVKLEDRDLFDQFTEVAQHVSTLTHQGLGNLQPEVYRRRLQELRVRQEQLEVDLSKRSAEYRQQLAPITVAALQAVLSNNTALVEWYCYKRFDPKAKDGQSQWGKPRYMAYVLKSSGELSMVDVGDAESTERLIHDFRTGLAEPTSTYVQEVAKELYEKLLKPLQRHLGSMKHLLISPDGALNLVPFAALIDEKGMYLGAKVTITYLTSGRDLIRYQTPSPGKGDAVIVADPNYGNATAVIEKAEFSDERRRSIEIDRGGLRFTPLPGTAEEAKILKTLLRISDDRVLTQAKATEDRFKQLHGPRILHIATHGFFLNDNELPAGTLKLGGFSEKVASPIGENPLLRSGLALAGANQRRSGEKDDGILTAAEVAQMDLHGTQLVVLSACETGVGDVQNGEGVYGLRRALVLAGAETQVTSLWRVADEATKDLMVDYYKRLLKGEGRSEALRHAQLAMMKSKDRSHPYYWAAFVPIGNSRPLTKRP